MNAEHLSTLDFPKVLGRLSTYASFSAGQELAHTLRPACDLQEVRSRLEATSEARTLLEARPEISLGGARDIRHLATAADRGAVLAPSDLVDVLATLVAARSLHRDVERHKGQLPRLAAAADRIECCPEIMAELNRCLDERGGLVDNASHELARIRRQIQVAHDRIQDKLQEIIHSPGNAPYLQEPLITQREGRYVVPLKAQFKDRIKGITHDRSASGVTLFIEPLPVVELNNAWRELQLEEREEINRILADLSNLVAERARDIELTVQALAELDVAFAKAKYAEAIGATAPELVPFRKREQKADSRHSGSTIRFFGARHPLLDVVLDDETHVLVVTGPNTGGKTVSLKTVGLLTLMAQAGLHIPAEPGSALSPFEAVYADIGDEQSIEQNLSTFSSHLTNIISFVNRANSRSLVLLDELGAGTDPAEGAALARALLDHFRRRGATTFVATHYPELKAYAQITAGVRNACVEFDPQTLSPTYRLTIGLPGRSNALAIALRLRLPEEIVEAARETVSQADLHTDDMLADIHRLRIQAAEERDAAHAARGEAERLSRELRDRLGSIEHEREEVLAQAREEAEKELTALRAEIRALRHRLQAAAAPLQPLAALEEDAKALERTAGLPQPAESPTAPQVAQHPVGPGDTVWVRPLNAQGQVLETSGDEAEVQVGRARTRVSVAALELRPPASPGPGGEQPARGAIQVTPAASPGVRVDLRGCTVEEALNRLDRHLDRAMRAGLPQVCIIHGKGTGALRRAVRSFLAEHPLVASHEGGGHREGGEGVTLAKLVRG